MKAFPKKFLSPTTTRAFKQRNPNGMESLAGLAPALAISVLEWSRVILVLNRYIGFCRATRAQLIALTSS